MTAPRQARTRCKALGPIWAESNRTEHKAKGEEGEEETDDEAASVKTDADAEESMAADGAGRIDDKGCGKSDANADASVGADADDDYYAARVGDDHAGCDASDGDVGYCNAYDDGEA